MVRPIVGSVVMMQFPFSDLSSPKRRPAIVLANTGRGDWIVCQVTSKAGNNRAIEITGADFESGGLPLTSYARPDKLFTAHVRLMDTQAGVLKAEVVKRVWQAITALGPEEDVAELN